MANRIVARPAWIFGDQFLPSEEGHLKTNKIGFRFLLFDKIYAHRPFMRLLVCTVRFSKCLCNKDLLLYRTLT